MGSVRAPKRSRLVYVIVRHGLYLHGMSSLSKDEPGWGYEWCSLDRVPITHSTRKEADAAIGKMPPWLRAGCEVLPREAM